MDTVPCPHCGAPLKPTATFCLECDKPVVAETSRLSVGEPTQVKVGRPIMGIAMIIAAVLVLGGAAYGTLAFVHHQRATTRAQATKDIRRGTTLLLEAEGGRASACKRVDNVLAGPAPLVHSECTQVVDSSPGVSVDKVVVDQLVLGGKTGTARVRATITDHSGTRTVEHSVNLLKVSKRWELNWDGHPTV